MKEERPNSLSFIFLLVFVGLLCQCLATKRRGSCVVRDDRADCSHLSLREIPNNLPQDISWLDVSHNVLGSLSPSALAFYPRLLHLDASFNSIKKVESGLCLAVPHLRTLSLQRNEMHLLTEQELSNCNSLSRLDLSDNRLKLKQEPFSALPGLTWLDVSRNNLASAKLGTKPQLWNLMTLDLSGNAISQLKKDDFSFLSNSSSFQSLGLSFLTLTTVEQGCLKPIAGLRDIVLNGCKLKPRIVTKICEELSGTAVRNLSLQNTALRDTLTNNTFKGLGNTNITTLDLSQNGISIIPAGTFQWLPQLENLSLGQNILRRLTSGTFYGLIGLRSLNLQRALIKSRTSAYPLIDNFSFQPLARLEHLYMSNTAFREITENTFTGLNSLRTLDLSWSSRVEKNISSRTFTSLCGTPLEVLNLTAAAIPKLGPSTFSCLGNLTTLLLGHNFIAQQLTGEEFRGLSRVEKLYLSFNQQRITLTPTSFIHVPMLKTLTLGRALTGNLDMHPSPFTPLVNLTVLDLSNNNIANINSRMLEGLSQLGVLRLQHNNLARVWKSANPGGPVLFLKDAKNLAVLEMDSNGLDEIPRAALRGLTQLKELSLSGNLLGMLHDSVFDDLISLRVFRLQKNYVTSVRPEIYRPALSNLSELRMEHNPFDCTCESILWFSTWLNSTNASVPWRTESYTCNTPAAYFNRSVIDFDALSCKDMFPNQALYVFSSTVVLMLLVTAFLVHYQGWRIEFYWSILVNRTLGAKDYSSIEERFEYDAYIIHAVQDRPWVEKRLLPLEDGNCTFFLEDRDAVPGCFQLNSIVDNIRRSRKIIFVVTEDLLNDPWCRQFKVHHALHQMMEDSRDSVMMIFLQDVADYRLGRSLKLRRGMLKSRCILEWPQQRERIPAFHQKLRLALATSNRVT